MVKKTLLSVTMLPLLALALPASAQQPKAASKAEPKFLDDISVSIPPQPTETAVRTDKADLLFTGKKTTASSMAPLAGTFSGSDIEKADRLQFKYALLMDVEVELVQNTGLFKTIDEWLGTRYKMGGNTKRGIDCSALVQTIFTSFYGLALPRTAREQYKATERISRLELREGDLVFFNTTGGVSHVGIYLQNNKFLHASSSMGVTISDLYDSYWVRRFIGVGRVANTQPQTLLTQL